MQSSGGNVLDGGSSQAEALSGDEVSALEEQRRAQHGARGTLGVSPPAWGSACILPACEWSGLSRGVPV